VPSLPYPTPPQIIYFRSHCWPITSPPSDRQGHHRLISWLSSTMSSPSAATAIRSKNPGHSVTGENAASRAQGTSDLKTCPILDKLPNELWRKIIGFFLSRPPSQFRLDLQIRISTSRESITGASLSLATVEKCPSYPHNSWLLCKHGRTTLG